MKKLIAACLFCLFLGSLAQAYTWWDLKEDFVEDTKEIFLKSVKTGYYHDFLERELAKKHKFGVSTGLLAYKFMALEPIAIYTPSSSDQIVESGMSFPIRIGRIPIGNGMELRDLSEKTETGTILDNVGIGFYLSQNFTTGRLGAGLTVNYNF